MGFNESLGQCKSRFYFLQLVFYLCTVFTHKFQIDHDFGKLCVCFILSFFFSYSDQSGMTEHLN